MNEKTEEIHCTTDEGKIAKNEWEKDDSDFYTVYIKIRIILFQYFLLTCFEKDTSVLLKVINI